MLPDSALPYLIIVQPLRSVRCEDQLTMSMPWSAHVFNDFSTECECYKTQQEKIDNASAYEDKLRQEAEQECEGWLKTHTIDGVEVPPGDGHDAWSKCLRPGITTLMKDGKVATCKTEETAKELGVQVVPLSYSLRSEAAFDPNQHLSTASIKLTHPDFSRVINQHPISGMVHFDCMTDKKSGYVPELLIQNLCLNAGSVNTDAGEFRDIRIGLLAPLHALASSNMPAPRQLSSQYVIPAGSFSVALSADIDSGTLMRNGQNVAPLYIDMDHVAQTFRFKGGPLNTTVETSRGAMVVELSVDMTGEFINFAPEAGVAELEATYEAGYDLETHRCGNAKPVILRADASYEMSKDKLSSLSSRHFRWYEDFRCATEKLWGEGHHYTIPKYELSLGAHHFTLVVWDAHDVPDTEAFDVVVADSVPPILTIPQDRIQICRRWELPVRLNLGRAEASDNCSRDVVIKNDAPEVFPAGATGVTWRAYDCHGNVTEATQLVLVIQLDGIKSGDIIRATAHSLRLAVEKIMARMMIWPGPESVF